MIRTRNVSWQRHAEWGWKWWNHSLLTCYLLLLFDCFFTYISCLFVCFFWLVHLNITSIMKKKLYRVANCIQWRLFASFSKQLSTKLFAFVYTKITTGHCVSGRLSVVRQKAEQLRNYKRDGGWGVTIPYPLHWSH